ncbi:hypothetical protein PghCCS26_54820 [Paenibacillus glycanilyticus]|uniref:Glycosyl transferase family 1 domain-containing protein n=1 Tax=Paenibacillus glycanilyticus TaxID=126569 RepID=A0ABQ6NVT0_9BACL|nr:glycosyltransferase family 4 protein [Paenibacillus glycanilyticus]GMK48352.1 hypothetical protein PghCCS26_54820 [Paenibacillus glycanilyticus]
MTKHYDYHLAIMRGSSQYVSPENYNVQEIGLGKALANLGWKITIFSSGKGKDSKIISDCITWHELPRIGGKFGWVRGAYSHLVNEKPDIIQCQDLSNLGVSSAYRAARKTNVPLVLSLGEYEANKKAKSAIINLNANIIRPSLQGVLCKTKSAINFAEDLRLLKTHYCPVGIDPSAYDQEVTSSIHVMMESIKEAKENGDTILVHIGRMDKEDNVSFLLNTVRKMKQKVKLILIGEPVTYVKHLEIYKEVSDRIILLGKVPNSQIGHLLNLADTYLACSSYEIFGMAAAESIYHNCPVVGFATGGISEIISHLHNGFLMDSRDSVHWAESLDTFIKDEKFKKWKVGCQISGNSFSWSSRAISYDNVYRQLVTK